VRRMIPTNPVNCRPMRVAALAILGMVAASLAGAFAAPASAAPRAPTVVVELFTSQGCSSCVKSGEIAEAADAKPHVIALTFAVDYWDYLGWEDTFAKTEFADRQRAYTKRFALRDVYTPQMVVDGQAQAAALHADTLQDMVKAAERVRRHPPALALAKDRLSIGAGSPPPGGADIWLVRYDPRTQSVLIKKGENRGKTIVAHNVVRQLVRLGGWAGKAKVLHLPAADTDGLKTVILVQGAHGGPILGAREF
jgi:hypothetical protein